MRALSQLCALCTLCALCALCTLSCRVTPDNAGARAPAPVASQSATNGGWLPQILSRGEPYLPDFSFAGYHFGEHALPNLTPTLEVTDFGALPDDALDDTEAIKRALAAAAASPGPVVLHFAKGRFLISDVLYLERSHLVVQGSGSGAGGTELFVTRPMADMARDPVIQKIEAYIAANDKRAEGKVFSPFSWTGGVLWSRRKVEPAQRSLARALDGTRGSHTLHLDKELALPEGSIVRLRWFNRAGDDSALLRHIYGLSGVKFGPRLSDPSGDSIASEEATVRAVHGTEVTLVQPLLHDIHPDWMVDLVLPEFMEEVGIEHLALEFASEPYAGHHLERGFNGIYLTGLAHSFIRDVRVGNADSAILSDDCANLSFSEVEVHGRRGHYGVHIGDVFDVLLEGFRIDTEEFHSVSFNTKSRANVATHGFIYRPSLDQHRGANHQDLFDDLTSLEDRSKSSLFEHGGADYWGPTHGAFNTFWNVHIEYKGVMGTPLYLGKIEDAGPARIVGLSSNVPLAYDYAGAYVEQHG
ncbi:MAG TPA: glycosyl hydrolase family 28-related protein, partial [Polyangiaceae bacterium]|nr:glycosyl hydrolase family 28-related protein [Polyangiaceae bacterium]